MYYKINKFMKTACDFFILKHIVQLIYPVHLCHSVTE